jgi:hypothetical protein
MPTTGEAPAAVDIVVARGNIYLSRAVCDAYLPDAQAVALLRRDAAVLIAPLARHSAGGLLLKVRNARGDRVIHAQEFLRSHGFVDDFNEHTVSATWEARSAALVLRDVPRACAAG